MLQEGILGVVQSQQFYKKMNTKEQQKECAHEFAPLGIQHISTQENFIEVIAVIFCKKCSMFRTKILYFDRQKAKDNRLT